MTDCCSPHSEGISEVAEVLLQMCAARHRPQPHRRLRADHRGCHGRLGPPRPILELVSPPLLPCHLPPPTA